MSEKIGDIIGDELVKDVEAIAVLQGVSSVEIIKKAVGSLVSMFRDAIAHC